MHCAEKIVSACLCISRKSETGGGGWGHPQGAVHMAAARLGCNKAMVDAGWANSHPGCLNGLRKRYSHLTGGSFLEGCLGAKQVFANREC